MKTKPLLILAIGLLAGCSVTPAYERPQPPMPAQYAIVADASVEAVDLEWWQRFDSDELDALMAEALAANHDLLAAVQRIEQSRASLIGARALLRPTVGATADGGASLRYEDGDSRNDESDGARVSVGYELDLFGGNAAAVDAARARLAGSEYGRDSVALVLQADVLAGYTQILALKERLAIARQNLDAARQVAELVQVRFDNGAATALDVARQRTTVLNIQAGIPALQQSLRETHNALAVLLGRPPQGFSVEAESLAELGLPAVDPGQPAELIERRPDIRIAEAELIAANADIGIARAALYPSMDLSASLGVDGVLTGGTSTLANLAASLTQSLFDAGRRQAQVDLSEAARRERVERYLQTVLNGLREVEDSLSAVATSEVRAGLLRDTAASAREAYALARTRYENGADDQLTLLDAQRTLLSAEDDLVQARLARFSAAIELYKALGGRWSSADG